MIRVVIPSKLSSNLFPCVEAIRQHEPDAEITVVDDGLDSVPAGVQVVNGVKPFVFARNANIGIRHALRVKRVNMTCSGGPMSFFEHVTEGEGVILLNDDALLAVPGGFSRMAQWQSGLVSSTTNIAGNPQQFRHAEEGVRPVEHVAFVCVWIPKATVECIGLLDEDFNRDYGCEDRDYCYRVRQSGLPIIVDDGCFVDHSALKSTFRGSPRAAKDFSQNFEVLKAKHPGVAW